MTTNELREAARQIRARAQKATPGEWYADGTEGIYAYGDADSDGCPTVLRDRRARPADIQHIAGWGPLPALAVADLLDAEADAADNYNGGHAPDRVLTIARAYLAPTSVHQPA